MEYLEWLEHADTFLRAVHDFEKRTAPPNCVALPPLALSIIQSEIQNERRRGELALELSGEQHG